jgi:hypothetical protein
MPVAGVGSDGGCVIVGVLPKTLFLDPAALPAGFALRNLVLSDEQGKI